MKSTEDVILWWTVAGIAVLGTVGYAIYISKTAPVSTPTTPGQQAIQAGGDALTVDQLLSVV